MIPWRRVARLSPDERRVVVWAVVLVAVVAVGLHVMPFRFLRATLARVARGPASTVLRIPLIVWAVTAAARRVPGADSCLVRALVAQALLARHGHAAELRLGVTRSAAGMLAAHAWVESGGQIVVGGAERADFTALPPLEGAPS